MNLFRDAMNCILVAVDSSPRAIDVLVSAVALARATGGKVHLLRVVGIPPELPANMFAMPQPQLVDTSVDAAKRDLELLAGQVPPGLLAGATAMVGIAWDAICSFARDHDVDLVVIGASGHRLIDRIMGTTAAKVVNHVDRPVLVVRPKGDSRHREKDEAAE